MVTTDDKLIGWKKHILPPATHEALEYLSGQKWLKKSKWYLAGGTALAIQIGHRNSVDLDFFTTEKDFAAGKLIDHFDKDAWSTDIMREGTLYGQLLGAKISFIAYPFFIPSETPLWYDSVRVLDKQDIAVMKIIAISQRGRKRDFIDLYWLCKNLMPLPEIIEKLPAQYPTVAHDYHHIIKSLSYFTDAEADPMPTLFFKASWPEIKKFFRQEAVSLAKKLLLNIK